MTGSGPGPWGGGPAPRPGDRRPPPLPPGPPGPRGRQRSPDIRPILFLAAAAAVIAVGAVVAALLLTSHHGPARHAAASTPPPTHRAQSPSRPPSPSPTPPPTPTGKPPAAPPRTAANGRLGVPRHIGSLRLNPALTDKFVGQKVRRQFANSFLIPTRDVASGFYTTDPSATTFTANDHRLMFLTAYLHGTGNAKSALHSFMANDTFTGQHQVAAGRRGGKAACGQLAHQATPVAHCMWADSNSYADFYAWNTSPAELASTMRTIRPEVQRTHR
jgi:hypothetical protein